jgi:type IV secretory pathway protease TraF
MIRIRRVVGDSMRPVLVPGMLVVAMSFRPTYKPDHVVIAEYGGREIIKRITDIRITPTGTEVFITGDNESASTDSRQFGWLPAATLKGKVIWPMRLHQNSMS